MSEEYMKERQVAIECVRLASQVTQAVFKRLVAEKDKMTVTKGDFSPVTAGDLACQAVVNTLLRRHFPNDPVVGEEDAAHLRTAEGAALCETVVTMANTVLSPPLTTNEVLDAIDYGMYSGGGKGRHWTLDPIDGTKGFLRQEQYAVCLALIHDGHVKVGVMGCPNLPRDASDPSLGNGALFVAVKGQGAFQRALEDPTETRIQVSSISSPADARFCESVESGHSNHSDSDTIAKLLGITTPPIRMDSQCKYASVARGDASIYLRLPTIKGYEEKIWDHASGNLLIEEAGGKVTDVKGKSLDFSIGRTLKANTGVIATNGPIHQAVVDAVMAVLYPPTNL